MVSLTAQGRTVPADVSGVVGTDNVKAFIASRVASGFVPPRTPWGDPDISGVFTTKDEANTPFERPDEWAGRTMDDITPQEFAEAVAKRQERATEAAPFAGGGEPEQGVAIAVPIHWFDNLAAQNSRPWFVVDPQDGKVPPITSDAAARPKPIDPRAHQPDTYAKRYLGDRCIALNGGPLRIPGLYGNSFQILQTPDHLVIRQEMVHEARVVPLDGRPHSSSKIRNYFGDSRAYWDGNTLVIESTNFHPELVLTRGMHAAPRTHLIERFTRIAPGTVEWTMTLDDPTTWERPWTYSMPMTEDNTQLIFEYACHEGNYGMANLLSAGRAAEK